MRLLEKRKDHPALERALELMAYSEYAVIFNLTEELRQCLKLAKEIKVDPDFMLTRKVVISPTKIYLTGPEIEVSNRVVRRYQEFSDRFFRVSFVDENFQQIVGADVSVHISQRVYSILSKGVRVSGVNAHFLAFSASQLREHSCWFFAPSKPLTIEKILFDMGDFSKINTVGKCAARMGQCFSSTFEISTVPRVDVKILPDIQTEDGDYTFSDGIGIISLRYAIETSEKLGKQRVASAYQIRFGGSKGVVAIHPRSHHKLYIRPSMTKFYSSHRIMEVISVSHFIPSYLNRQIINLLSLGGVPDSVFIRLQDEMLLTMDLMLKDDEIARKTLKAMPDQHGFSKTVTKMLKAGFSVRTEPFLYNLLKALHAKLTLDLKLRSRIFLKNSACLMGTIDEFQCLEYGEVFFQISKPCSKNPRVITGDVFVVKNPAFLPGDIRMLKAVDRPELRHMIDCLVFPAKGPRPHSNETSGSDLDGDIYTVCWEKDLIPPKTFAPGNYAAPHPVWKDTVTKEDICKFFVDYMSNDSLGVIANTHLAIADASKLGPDDPRCLQLAELHSIAVDFPKTGVPAQITKDLRVSPEVGYPDYMEKKGKSQYVSEKVLGVLYRRVHPKSYPPMCGIFDKDLLYEGYQEYLQEAEVMKADYDFNVLSVMNQYGIQSEAELMSGCILKFSKQILKKTAYNNSHKIGQVVIGLKRRYPSKFDCCWRISFDCKRIRKAFEDELLVFPEALREQERRAKASAWYSVSYKEYSPLFAGVACGSRSNVQLLGLPWIVFDVLVRIKQGASL